MLNDTNKQVLKKIIESPGLSRADLSRIFDINRSTCSYITKELLDSNLIIFKREKNNGRLGQYIYFNYDHEPILCIEFGKRKIKIFVTNLGGDVKYQEYINIDTLEFAQQLESLKNSISTILAKHTNVSKATIAIHGTFDNITQSIHSPFSEITYEDIKLIFSKHNIDFVIINESNAYTLGIIDKNNFSSGICINIKDGVGAGVVLDSKLVTGANGVAGEIGHFIIDQSGKQCNCGNSGCIELYISDTNTLIECRQKTLLPIRKKNISTFYEDNEKVQKIFQRNFTYLASLINNMSLLLNPEFIYIASEVYSEIDGAVEIVKGHLTSDNMILENLEIEKYDIQILVNGMCKAFINQRIC